MNLVCISYNKFPNGDAGAVREYMLGKLFKENQIKVFYIGMGNINYGEISNYNEFEYTSLRREGTKIVDKIGNYFFHRRRLIQFLEQYKKTNTIDAILLVSPPLNTWNYIKKLARKDNIKLYHDCVEWYSPGQFKLGVLSPSFLIKEITNRLIISKEIKVISISSFLDEYFKKKGIQSVRIPVILDPNEINVKKMLVNNRVVFLYAGSPGKKDYLKEIIGGFALLNEKVLKQMEIRIIGITKEKLIAQCGVLERDIEKISKSITIYGRLKREEVLIELIKADFTVLLRSETLRYAKAGFPTKVVESLLCSTPVICNITSDLGDFIKDGENSIIVEDCSSDSFYFAIKRAMSITFEEREKMNLNARKCAETNFDYRKYVELIKSD